MRLLDVMAKASVCSDQPALGPFVFHPEDCFCLQSHSERSSVGGKQDIVLPVDPLDNTTFLSMLGCHFDVMVS